MGQVDGVKGPLAQDAHDAVFEQVLVGSEGHSDTLGSPRAMSSRGEGLQPRRQVAESGAETALKPAQLPPGAVGPVEQEGERVGPLTTVPAGPAEAGATAIRRVHAAPGVVELGVVDEVLTQDIELAAPL